MPRQPRGAQRREALLDAAVAVVAERGLSALTHRAVAERAQVPLAATTYYFASRDDLLEQALRRFVDQDLAASRAVPSDDVVSELISVVIGEGEADRGASLMAYEVYVQAGRSPRLRAIARDWNAGITEHLRQVLERHGRRQDRAWAVSALLDGFVLELLVADDPEAVTAARDELTAALTDLLR